MDVLLLTAIRADVLLLDSKSFIIVNTMYQAPTVKKAFLILDLVARRDKCLTISDLSRELAISKSTVHGIVLALEGIGAIARDDKTKRYTLGMTLFELAYHVYARIDLKDIARPILDGLMQSTQQSVFLGIRSGDRVTIVDLVESTQNLKITAHIGARLPLLVGATGKALLASMPDHEAAQLIHSVGLRKNTENSITDPETYLEEIRRARKSGYALDDEEYLQGVRAVAVPIQAHGRQLSAIWVVGFSQSMPSERMTAIAVQTKEAAEAIARKLEPRQPENLQ
jgi:DNA-binding IclR family transcriptional regulator